MQFTKVLLYSIVFYLIMLIFLGVLASRKKKSNSFSDFYLAGKGLNSLILLLTLYATQYSANTLLITPAEVVNKGMGMILILGYMTAVAVFYLIFAPQLYEISHKKNFITPGDWFDFRFKMPKLTLFANILLIIVSVNFLLSQLIAMGHITNGITGGQIPYWAGVIFLGFVVIIYETLGGMRAVAWTDVIQGIMILFGLIGIFLIVVPDIEELTNISKWLIKNEPKKIGIPNISFQIYWMSTVIMVGLGASVYPQVIQRIYAAKSVNSLKKSLGAMIVMPLFTVLILFLLGVISIPHFSNIDNISKDTVLPTMLHLWSKHSALAFALTVIVIIGLLAAIMSTADSVLLSLSSIFAKDILGKSALKNSRQEKLTKYGKLFSWIIMLIMVLVALNPHITLWGLIELKMQVLIQVAPLFLVGIYNSKIGGSAMMLGLVLGFIFVFINFLLGFKTIGHIQVGLIGFVINMLSIFGYSYFLDKK